MDNKNITCRRCDGFIALDVYSCAETFTKEVYCFNCGDRWWVPFHAMGRATEFQGARKPDAPPMFEPWEIAASILSSTQKKAAPKERRGWRGRYDNKRSEDKEGVS